MIAAPTTRSGLDRTPRWSSIRKILSRIAKFADVRADRGSLQVQRFGYLPFWAPLPPKPYKQLIAFGFGRTLSRQEFRRRERADMPVRYPCEQLGEADPQSAREPDHREDPEVAGAALEIDKITPAHRRPVAEGMLGEVSSVALAQDVLPQAPKRRLRLRRSVVMHPERTGGRVPGNPGDDEPTPHVEAAGQFQDESQLRNP
jgi:hypothetical protein